VLNLTGYFGAFVVVAGAIFSAIGHRNGNQEQNKTWRLIAASG
jgi:hypothetical protein